MSRRQRGQVAAEFALVAAFAVAGGAAGLQFLGLAGDSLRVAHAAQEAAYVAGSLPAADRAASLTPCWQVGGGLLDPGGLGEAPVCRSVVENFGVMDPSRAQLTVAPEQGRYHVTVRYAEPVGSPFLRLFFGDTFTTTQDAWSR
ncbi:MAG: hypothetical protein E6J00_05300 [Chloroflexi bacterium]|nr:MAG: hypothetical protein E6J00_05300 [Chloroflexota bacterium]